jgi:hypothetical protein
MKLSKLDISQIFHQDFEEINSARKKGKILHATHDIDASGDEVENTVRRVLRRKLPMKYYVSQGHIVDETLQTSSQLDIIIADNSGSPVLFTSENGTEYFPYESIYAFGEIKSTYYSSKNYVEDFVNVTKSIYDNLNRKNTSQDQITQDLALTAGAGMGYTSNDMRPFKNPLFKFMVFVSHNDLKINSLKHLFQNNDDKYLPNVICFLDKGVLVKTKIELLNGQKAAGPVQIIPEFIANNKSNEYKWLFYEFESSAISGSANLAFLLFSLNSHLRDCLVLRPNILNYFNSMFTYKIIGEF